MQTFNIHEAKTHLSRLVDSASRGESFIVAKAGKPLVRVSPLDALSAGQQCRMGFLKGCFKVPDDFDELGRKEIEALFGGGA